MERIIKEKEKDGRTIVIGNNGFHSHPVEGDKAMLWLGV